MLSEKLDVLRLAFYTAPISCCVLLPLFIFREVRCFFASSRDLQVPGWRLVQCSCWDTGMSHRVRPAGCSTCAAVDGCVGGLLDVSVGSDVSGRAVICAAKHPLQVWSCSKAPAATSMWFTKDCCILSSADIPIPAGPQQTEAQAPQPARSRDFCTAFSAWPRMAAGLKLAQGGVTRAGLPCG